jgi:hypothetical protein
VTLARFVPTARFVRNDLLQMLEALDEIIARARARCPDRVVADLGCVGRWLRQVADGPSARLAGRPMGASLRARHRPPGGVAGNVLGCDVVVSVATDQVLDAAARLLDAFALLDGRGLPIEAFAIEGIEGRLLEAALGAGRIEEAGGRTAC